MDRNKNRLFMIQHLRYSILTMGASLNAVETNLKYRADTGV